MKSHQVHIHLNGKKFRYAKTDDADAASIVVRRGDHVGWHCKHGDYAVRFKKKSPFADVEIRGRKGTETASAVVVGAPGSYAYSVTVHLDDGPLIDDPIIIIDGDGD